MKPIEVEIAISGYTDKGYGSGEWEGRTVHVLGALPGEMVVAKIFKKRKGVLLADLVNLLKANPSRVEPKDEAYTSTSPLQIISHEGELDIKKANLVKLHSGLDVIEINEIVSDSNNQWNYRNKVEFSLYGDENDKIHLAFHKRGSSKGKLPVQSTSIASDLINQSAQKVVELLNKAGVNAFSFKSIIVRSSLKTNSAVTVVYCKEAPENEIYTKLKEIFEKEFDGNIHLVYSFPKSPASIITDKIYSKGEWDLVENLAGMDLTYPVDSFFQVNTQMFENIANDLKNIVSQIPAGSRKHLLDLYAGVGTLGLTVANLFESVHGIELFEHSKKYALENAQANNISNYSFEVAPAAELLNSIKDKDCVIVDPPRSGLELKVVDALLEHTPEYLLYISCNPITQKRDLESLLEKYEPTFAKAYNMYPKTPHLESFVALKRK